MAKQQAEPKSKLRFDLLSLKPGEQVVSAFSELQNYPAFVQHGTGENNWAAKFAIWYADAASDFRNLSIDLKRERCLKEAEVPKGHPRRAAVLAGTDQAVLALIVEYVRLQDWLEYATIFHGREYIWRLLATLASPDEPQADEAKKGKPTPDKDKNGSLAFALTQVQELDKRWNALFLGDAEVKATAQAQSQRDKLRSETQAEQRTFIPQ